MDSDDKIRRHISFNKKKSALLTAVYFVASGMLWILYLLAPAFLIVMLLSYFDIALSPQAMLGVLFGLMAAIKIITTLLNKFIDPSDMELSDQEMEQIKNRHETRFDLSGRGETPIIKVYLQKLNDEYGKKENHIRFFSLGDVYFKLRHDLYDIGNLLLYGVVLLLPASLAVLRAVAITLVILVVLPFFGIDISRMALAILFIAVIVIVEGFRFMRNRNKK